MLRSYTYEYRSDAMHGYQLNGLITLNRFEHEDVVQKFYLILFRKLFGNQYDVFYTQKKLSFSKQNYTEIKSEKKNVHILQALQGLQKVQFPDSNYHNFQIGSLLS